MWEIFAFGGIFFWLLVFVEFCFLCSCIYHSRTWHAPAFSLLVFALLLQFFGQIPIGQFVWNNPGTCLFWSIVFLIIGSFWAICKWWFFVRDNRQRYDESFAEFIEKTGYDARELSVEQRVEWHDYLNGKKRYYFNDYDEYRSIVAHPKASEHKHRIKVWVAFWPISLFWTMLNDPIMKAINMIYIQLHGLLQRISDSVWTGTEHHKVTEEEIKAVYQERQKRKNNENL